METTHDGICITKRKKKYFKPIFFCFFFSFQLSCESPRGTGGSIRFCDCAARCKSEIRECLFWPWQRINTKSPSCLPIAIYWPSKSSAGRPWLGHKINACGAHRTDKSDMGAIDRRQAARIHRHCTHTFMPPRCCYCCSVCVCVPLELALLKQAQHWIPAAHLAASK